VPSDGRLDQHEVGGGPPHRAPVDPVAQGKADGAAADLIDNAGEVVSEAGRHREAKQRRELRLRGERPVHRIQAHRTHPDTDLARAGVRLQNLP
jgi:hypothetical protein